MCINSRWQVVGSVMKLRVLVAQYRLIEVRCDECCAKTPLDPTFFLARRGDIELERLREHLFCAACGSADITLTSVAPAESKVSV
jgi:hypothetical protein